MEFENIGRAQEKLGKVREEINNIEFEIKEEEKACALFILDDKAFEIHYEKLQAKSDILKRLQDRKAIVESEIICAQEKREGEIRDLEHSISDIIFMGAKVMSDNNPERKVLHDIFDEKTKRLKEIRPSSPYANVDLSEKIKPSSSYADRESEKDLKWVKNLDSLSRKG